MINWLINFFNNVRYETCYNGFKYKLSGKRAYYKDGVWDLWVRVENDNGKYYIKSAYTTDGYHSFIELKYILPIKCIKIE